MAEGLDVEAREATSQRPDDTGAAALALVPLLEDYLDDLALRTAARLDDVVGVSVAVTLQVGNEPATVGASNPLAAKVDHIQYEIGTGPCLHALRHGEGQYVPDLARDDRWGTYGPLAAAAGAACCVSVPVMVQGRPAAAFKVYSSQVDGLSEGQRSLASAVAVEVAGGIGLARHLTGQARALDDRESAMNTRRAIDLALGVLMERNQCGPDEAFAILRSYSQNYNVKLRDVAREVVAAVPGAGSGTERSPFNPPRTSHAAAPGT